MKRHLVTATIVSAVLHAAPAFACTLIIPSPAQVLAFQREARLKADAVFLARATPDEHRNEADLTLVTSILGEVPPRQSTISTNSDTSCGLPPTEGVVIAFARRIAVTDSPWRFWERKRLRVVTVIYPDEVVDPGLALALRQAAQRLSRTQ